MCLQQRQYNITTGPNCATLLYLELFLVTLLPSLRDQTGSPRPLTPPPPPRDTAAFDERPVEVRPLIGIQPPPSEAAEPKRRERKLPPWL